tara:strand:- start:1498 stop:2676 length:1179 start_codon:yes stop_codon:yes gene_type:complete
MAANQRIYFAIQGLAVKPDAVEAWGQAHIAHGVQSVAVTTTFNLEQAFELGQLEIYENIEGVPDIEVSVTKVLDGFSPIYLLATTQAATPTLGGRSTPKSIVGLGIWSDSSDNIGAGGNREVSHMEASGMFVGSVTYNFPLEDNFTEDVTLVGNDKIWAHNDCGMTDLGVWNTGYFAVPSQMAANNDQPYAETGGDGNSKGGINRRENMLFSPNAATSASAAGVDYTQLPDEIPGISTSGVKSAEAHVQSITVSTDFGREEIFELGTRQPYARVVTFPVEVTTDIEVLSVSGDMINALSDGCGATAGCDGVVDNLSNQIINITACEGTRIYLGSKNKLASVNYGGGDAGGGNVTVTYSYTTFNDFTVMHPKDQATSFAWTDRTKSGWLGWTA